MEWRRVKKGLVLLCFGVEFSKKNERRVPNALSEIIGPDIGAAEERHGQSHYLRIPQFQRFLDRCCGRGMNHAKLTLLDVIQKNDDIGGMKALLLEAILSEEDAASQAEVFSQAIHGCS
ncbi:hypothetical protein M5K25_001954 [Dendrobium thyrsiflorum]|uniref:Uncharacterized protein n=1 Tax=Dendrobium thyrsiflorum TaxID=117978 RepID=A0ABD0W1F8_DENTH